MKLKIGGPCGIALDRLLVRVDQASSWKSTLIPMKATPATCYPARRVNSSNSPFYLSIINNQPITTNE